MSDHFSPSESFGSSPVGSISSGPLDQREIGTSAITNGAGRRSRRGRGPSGIAAPSTPEGPDLGLGGDFSGASAIIDASGVKKKYNSGLMRSTYSRDDYTPDERGWATGSALTDADPARPPTTPAIDPGSPLLTRIRAKLSPPDYFAE